MSARDGCDVCECNGKPFFGSNGQPAQQQQQTTMTNNVVNNQFNSNDLRQQQQQMPVSSSTNMNVANPPITGFDTQRPIPVQNSGSTTRLPTDAAQQVPAQQVKANFMILTGVFRSL